MGGVTDFDYRVLKRTIKMALEKHEYKDILELPVEVLLNTTDIKNLVLFGCNIFSLKLEKHKSYKFSFWKKRPHDEYSPFENKIFYVNLNSIPHELLHVASTRVYKDTVYCGFQRIKGGRAEFTGVNEGYTELLSQRKFFGGDYDTPYYTTPVFIMRLYELLLDDPRDLETAYFRNDINFLYDAFKNYGSKDEFIFIMRLLEIFVHKEERYFEIKKGVKQMRKIISRTCDYHKIRKANKIINEFRYYK